MFPHIRSIIKQMYEVNHQREMVLVEKFFQEYFNEVTEHLDYEDKVVFPYTESLLEHIEKQKPVDKPYSYSVDVYKDHHNNIEEKLTDLKNLLVKYLPLNNDQQIRRSLFFSLTELEHDLNVHAKIEDMILIPLVEKTVITHRKNISLKTGIKSVSGLTIYAVVKKLITLDSPY